MGKHVFCLEDTLNNHVFLYVIAFVYILVKLLFRRTLREMNIQYVSDLHLEFMNQREYTEFEKRFPIHATILVLAGDIGNPKEKTYEMFLTFVSKHFEKVFLIAGNHEFYKNTYKDTIQTIETVVKAFENITFLHNSFEDYKGVRWIGTIQWTPITNPSYTINDTELIQGMTVERYNALFEEAKEFLENALESCVTESKKAIVITHHLPIAALVLPQYKTYHFAPYNQWFHANLDSLIDQYQKTIVGWFYGHTHSGSVQTHYGIPFFCSPKGYPNEFSNHLPIGNMTTLSCLPSNHQELFVTCER